MSKLHRTFVPAVLVGLLVCAPTVSSAQEKPVTEVIDLIGCTLCHQVENRILGPSFKEVATKYKGDKDALDRAAERIVKGSKGVWGEVAMPPNNITNEEARRIAAWVLAR